MLLNRVDVSRCSDQNRGAPPVRWYTLDSGRDTICLRGPVFVGTGKGQSWWGIRAKIAVLRVAPLLTYTCAGLLTG